jgi:DNA-binding SARP family transcriptional activator
MLVRQSDAEEVQAPGARLRLIGSFELSRGGATARLPLMAQRLAALLAVRDETVDRSRAAGILSPDVEHHHALANLRTALWRLRGTTYRIVQPVGGSLRLAPNVSVDVRESDCLARRVLSGDIGRDEAMAAASALSGDLLPDWDDEWLVFDRERFRELRLHALERLCGQLTASGDHAEAVECGLLAIEAEPLRESAHRALMRAYISEGNHAQAVQHLRLLERQLWQELEVAPSQETIDLATGRNGYVRDVRP